MFGSPLVRFWMHASDTACSVVTSALGVAFGVGAGATTGALLGVYMLFRFGRAPRVSWTWTDDQGGVSLLWNRRGPTKEPPSTRSEVASHNPDSDSSSERAGRWVSRGVQTGADSDEDSTTVDDERSVCSGYRSPSID